MRLPAATWQESFTVPIDVRVEYPASSEAAPINEALPTKSKNDEREGLHRCETGGAKMRAGT